MRALFAAIVAIALFFSGAARASVIENGIYYASTEPGRGYSIEQQGGQLTMIFYVYQTTGTPIWYFASGPYSLNSAGYPSTSLLIYQYAGGQCLGCAFTAPTGAAVGAIDIVFTSAQRATINLVSGPFGSTGGTSIAIERFRFTDAANPLLGQWALTYSIGTTPTYANTYGEFVQFTSAGGASTGTSAGSTGVVTGTAGYSGECYSSGEVAGYCIVVYISVGTTTVFNVYYLLWPQNEWRGYFRVSTPRYRAQGVRVAGPGESTLFGLGNAFDRMPEAPAAAAAAMQARVEADRAVADVAPTLGYDADPNMAALDRAAAALIAKVLASR